VEASPEKTRIIYMSGVLGNMEYFSVKCASLQHFDGSDNFDLQQPCLLMILLLLDVLVYGILPCFPSSRINRDHARRGWATKTRDPSLLGLRSGFDPRISIGLAAAS